MQKPVLEQGEEEGGKMKRDKIRQLSDEQLKAIIIGGALGALATGGIGGAIGGALIILALEELGRRQR